LFSLFLLLILVVIFGTTSPFFLMPENIFTLLREASVTGILAVGVTFVIITAGIDLSNGAILAFVAMVCANIFYYTDLPVWAALAVGLLIGLAAGYANGLLVTKLHLPDFIATLSTQGIFRGLTLIIAIRTATGTISNKMITNEDFLILGGHIDGLYLVTIAFFIIAALGQILLKRTPFGTYTYAVGASRKSADLSGIDSDRIKRVVYTMSGLCAAVGAFFLSAKMETAIPELGTGLEFDVIAAVVIGGCAFSGGRGDVFGSVVGALFMSVLTNGIYKYNLPAAYHIIIKGGVIIVMVIFDSVYRQYMEERIRKAGKSLEPDPAAAYAGREGCA
jgi:Ribose/xylose/arabinose/galactoside ABC-type transport systems, permease components